MTMQISRKVEELDLAIPSMETEEAKKGVARALDGIAGILSVRSLERGVFIRYNPDAITKDQVCDIFHKAGLRPGVFQDSKTERAGTPSR